MPRPALGSPLRATGLGEFGAEDTMLPGLADVSRDDEHDEHDEHDNLDTVHHHQGHIDTPHPTQRATENHLIPDQRNRMLFVPLAHQILLAVELVVGPIWHGRQVYPNFTDALRSHCTCHLSSSTKLLHLGFHLFSSLSYQTSSGNTDEGAR